jgi:hypothetical protein
MVSLNEWPFQTPLINRLQGKGSTIKDEFLLGANRVKYRRWSSKNFLFLSTCYREYKISSTQKPDEPKK